MDDRPGWRRALDRADAQKRRARMVRAELQAGVLTLSQALADPGVAGLTVGRVIQWLPRYGPHRADLLLQRVRINPARRCGQLTEHQRLVLEQAVRR